MWIKFEIKLLKFNRIWNGLRSIFLNKFIYKIGTLKAQPNRVFSYYWVHRNEPDLSGQKRKEKKEFEKEERKYCILYWNSICMWSFTLALLFLQFIELIFFFLFVFVRFAIWFSGKIDNKNRKFHKGNWSAQFFIWLMFCFSLFTFTDSWSLCFKILKC